MYALLENGCRCAALTWLCTLAGCAATLPPSLLSQLPKNLQLLGGGVHIGDKVMPCDAMDGPNCIVNVSVTVPDPTKPTECKIDLIPILSVPAGTPAVIWTLPKGGTFMFIQPKLATMFGVRVLDSKDWSNPASDIFTPAPINTDYKVAWELPKYGSKQAAKSSAYEVYVGYMQSGSLVECLPKDPIIMNNG